MNGARSSFAAANGKNSIRDQNRKTKQRVIRLLRFSYGEVFDNYYLMVYSLVDRSTKKFRVGSWKGGGFARYADV